MTILLVLVALALLSWRVQRAILAQRMTALERWKVLIPPPTERRESWRVIR